MLSVLFLDIDGVLNPQDTTLDELRRAHPVGGWHTTTVPGRGAAFLSTLIASTLVRDVMRNVYTVVWATAWVNWPDHLAEYERACGLPELDRIPIVTHDPHGSGKIEGIHRWLTVNGRGPWILVDDEASTTDRDYAVDTNGTIVTPESTLGLAATETRIEMYDAIYGIGNAPDC